MHPPMLCLVTFTDQLVHACIAALLKHRVWIPSLGKLGHNYINNVSACCHPNQIAQGSKIVLFVTKDSQLEDFWAPRLMLLKLITPTVTCQLAQVFLLKLFTTFWWGHRACACENFCLGIRLCYAPPRVVQGQSNWSTFDVKLSPKSGAFDRYAVLAGAPTCTGNAPPCRKVVLTPFFGKLVRCSIGPWHFFASLWSVQMLISRWRTVLQIP